MSDEVTTQPRRRGRYHGQVFMRLPDAINRDAVSARVANVEQRALLTQPERRIVASNCKGNTLEVLMTSQKLAHRIAREVEKVFGGRAHFSWSNNDGSLLATVRIAPNQSRSRK
jgi:hypothetical protein